jgi:hypothetical protein
MCIASHERRHEFACSGTFRRVNTPTHAMLPRQPSCDSKRRVRWGERVTAQIGNRLLPSSSFERRNVVDSLSTAAPPMGNADEPILFKCAHIEFVGGNSFDRTAVGAKPRSFIFLRWGAANGVA